MAYLPIPMRIASALARKQEVRCRSCEPTSTLGLHLQRTFTISKLQGQVQMPFQSCRGKLVRRSVVARHLQV